MDTNLRIAVANRQCTRPVTERGRRSTAQDFLPPFLEPRGDQKTDPRSPRAQNADDGFPFDGRAEGLLRVSIRQLGFASSRYAGFLVSMEPGKGMAPGGGAGAVLLDQRAALSGKSLDGGQTGDALKNASEFFSCHVSALARTCVLRRSAAHPRQFLRPYLPHLIFFTNRLRWCFSADLPRSTCPPSGR